LSSPCPLSKIPPPRRHRCCCPLLLLPPATLVANRHPSSRLPMMVSCRVVCSPFTCCCIVRRPHLSAPPLCDHQQFCRQLPSQLPTSPAAFLSLLFWPSIAFTTHIVGCLLCSLPTKQHSDCSTKLKTFSCFHVWTYFDLRTSVRLGLFHV